MTKHIAFCLEEIEAEIGALKAESEAASSALAHLLQHVGAMRAILATHNASKATVADDLTFIRGIDADRAIILRSKGVSRFSDIANWREADITALGNVDLSLDRIAHENWIEQAAILATGNTTHFATRKRRGDFSCLVQATDADRLSHLIGEQSTSEHISADPVDLTLREMMTSGSACEVHAHSDVVVPIRRRAYRPYIASMRRAAGWALLLIAASSALSFWHATAVTALTLKFGL